MGEGEVVQVMAHWEVMVQDAIVFFLEQPYEVIQQIIKSRSRMLTQCAVTIFMEYPNDHRVDIGPEPQCVRYIWIIRKEMRMMGYDE